MESQVSRLSDHELVEIIEAQETLPASVIDDYYRRCIPLYLDFLGPHWHTGFYRDQDADISPRDQVRMIDHVADLLGLGPGTRVLDVGCGIGATVCHLNQSRGCEAVGLTPVAEQRLLGERLARERGAQVRIDLGHAEELPYPDGTFDAVIFFESSCHFSDRAAFFAEAFRVLKPGGRVGGEDWLAVDLANAALRKQYIDPICKSWAIPMLADAHEYRGLMAAAGFVDIDVIDMKNLMPLQRGFAVSGEQLDELRHEIDICPDALLRLTLTGLARLGEAMNRGAFTIARMNALKPSNADPGRE